MKDITYKFTADALQNFREVYKGFLEYEDTTPNKELWIEQKKIYEEILNAEDPRAAYEVFEKLNMTTFSLALQRMKALSPVQKTDSFANSNSEGS